MDSGQGLIVCSGYSKNPSMEILPTEITDVLLLKPRVFGDDRGFFFESWNKKTFSAAVGRPTEFVQDNYSRSSRGVLRGLHHQVAPSTQGKLVAVLAGSIFDVAVDLRPNSASFGSHVGFELSVEQRTMIWIPPGFAHGFLVMSESADVQYKTTEFYSPAHERCLRWDDPVLNIPWPLSRTAPILSSKDDKGVAFVDTKF